MKHVEIASVCKCHISVHVRTLFRHCIVLTVQGRYTSSLLFEIGRGSESKLLLSFNDV
jgi:hypothetical protein